MAVLNFPEQKFKNFLKVKFLLLNRPMFSGLIKVKRRVAPTYIYEGYIFVLHSLLMVELEFQVCFEF